MLTYPFFLAPVFANLENRAAKIQRENHADSFPLRIGIFYVTKSGTARKIAEKIVLHLSEKQCEWINNLRVELLDLVIVGKKLWREDVQKPFSTVIKFFYSYDVILFILPTWTDGESPPGADFLEKVLQQEIQWRKAQVPSSFPNVRVTRSTREKHNVLQPFVAVCGLGNSNYPNYCTFASRVHELCGTLGMEKLLPLWTWDEGHDELELMLPALTATLEVAILNVIKNHRNVVLGNVVKRNIENRRSAGQPERTGPACDESAVSDSSNYGECNLSYLMCPTRSHGKMGPWLIYSTENRSAASDEQSKGEPTKPRIDMSEASLVFESTKSEVSSFESSNDESDEEDLGGLCCTGNPDADVEDGLVKQRCCSDSEQDPAAVQTRHRNGGHDGTKKSMLTSTMRRLLTKEGYQIVGSHSAVKLCRWTKAQLRGRGGCYKHTFYNITSSQCMEATPSLACANKCIFCWRHHKNPVGRSWRWQLDGVVDIVNGMVNHHLNLIKIFKGAQGVVPERFDKASKEIAHCALSLVGEPIMYPYINDFLSELHRRKISTFLVTNAQFPDKMRELVPVTQLYVSVDAADKEALKVVDRPLFVDFWERFLECLRIVSRYPQRTVFRLTLIKKYNMLEARKFAELILLGNPDFIEIKAVTFAGKQKGEALITMEHIPWHREVVAYGTAIVDSLKELGCAEEYEICAEHEHSCCLLIARKAFFVNGAWNIWIDYPKFFELVNSGEQFTARDYSAPAPGWAVYGAPERGFDPSETRIFAKGSKKRAALRAKQETNKDT